MTDGRKATPLAISLDEALLREIDRVAAERADSRSSIMRAAIRAGLPIVAAGADAGFPLAGEIAEDVRKVAQWHGWSVARVVAESVRLGLPAVHSRFAHNEGLAKANIPEEERASMEEALYAFDPEALPLARDYRRAMRQLNIQRNLIAQIREIPEGEAVLAKIEAVYARRKARGLPLGLASSTPGVIPLAEFNREVREMDKEVGQGTVPEIGPYGTRIAKDGGSNRAPSAGKGSRGPR